MHLWRILSIAFTVFGLLFGSGNIIFPLNLGRLSGDKVLFSLLGLGLSAVMIPLVGLVASMLFDGSYKKFLGMAGKIPSKMMIFLCFMLIGPFAVVPRCIALSYSSVERYIPGVSLFVFSLFAAIAIFSLIVRKGIFLDLLGKFLGPLKLLLLMSIIVVGIFAPHEVRNVAILPVDAFMFGLTDGLQMLDLLGVIFFSGLIITAIRQQFADEKLSAEKIAMIGLKGGTIGALMLGVVYTGFAYVAAMYGDQLIGLSSDRLLSALAVIILGEKAAILANMSVAIACLTTATALASIFSDYIRTELFNERISYPFSLLITVIIAFVMANLGFAKIMELTFPIIVVLYPTLIILTFANIAHRLYGFSYVKQVVSLTFLTSIALKFWLF